MAMLQWGVSGSSSDAATIPNSSQPTWPVETEVNVVSGTNKVVLGNQSQLLRFVIQEAFEHLRSALCFIDAFPNAMAMPSMIRDCLISAAKSHGPRASNIHQRLLSDEDYVDTIIPLVSFNVLVLFDH
jgi:hypothetical protein